MERRRRAFGLKNVGNQKEKPVAVASTSADSAGSPTSSLKSAKPGPRSNKQCIVPEPCTPKRKVGREPSELPQRSVIVSPSFQPVFPRTLSSPEIEVSWDWGCSQATNDMLPPPKRPKRKCQMQISPLVEPVATYSRLTQSQEVTTKENEERLAFYKNILSKSFQKKSESAAVTENNNVQVNTTPHKPEACTTPQRPRRSSVGLNKSKELINDPFDDSANEFMFECSQAIEEKLKNGEIEVGPLVKIDLANRGLSSQSQQTGRKVSQEKTKQNLFPSENDADVQKRPLGKGIKSPQNKRNQANSVDSGLSPEDKSGGSNKSYYLTNDLHTVLTPKNLASEKPSLVNKKSETNTTSSIRTSSGSFNTVNKTNVTDRSVVLTNLNPKNTEKRQNQMLRECNRPNLVPNRSHENSSKYDSVDKFRRQQPGSSMCQTKPNVPNAGNSKVSANDKKFPLQVTHPSPRQVQERLTNVRINNSSKTSSGTKGEETASITSLLDDDFDVELSSLDFDSLVQPVDQPTNKRPLETTKSQKCSKQEIEAKRLAAINRLMMKKKR